MPTILKVKKEIVVAVFLFLIAAIFSLIDFSPVSVKPNIFLASIIAAALLIDTWYVYFGLVLGELLWLKFTPYFIPEYAVIFVIALAAYLLIRIFIFAKSRLIRIFLILLLQIIFWLLLQAGPEIISLVFLLELVYNIIATELFYALASWLKKTSF